jgi:hypothetical protein
VRDVELEEEDVVENRVDVSIADEDEDEEGNRDEVADASDDGRKSPYIHDFVVFLFPILLLFLIKTNPIGKMA